MNFMAVVRLRKFTLTPHMQGVGGHSCSSTDSLNTCKMLVEKVVSMFKTKIATPSEENINIASLYFLPNKQSYKQTYLSTQDACSHLHLST